MLDHCDNVASGGTMDTTAVLAEVLRQDLRDVVFYAIHDPESVRAAIAAGVGETLTLEVGGRAAMPSIVAPATPLRVTGTVKRITDGVYTLRGPMGAGATTHNGPTVVLRVGGRRPGADLTLPGALRPRVLHHRRHRSDPPALRGDQEPRALARGAGRARA